MEEDGTNEDVDWSFPGVSAHVWVERVGLRWSIRTDTTADEGEQERRVAGDLRRDLELEKTRS